MSDKVLDTLVAWGERTPEIRAMALTSTRARAHGPVDEFSDYDVILAVTDPASFASDDLGWQTAYGTPLVRWGDEDELYGWTTYFRGVIYQDHVKVDFTIWPDALLEALAERETLPPGLDHGYRVLLDKDGGTRRWPQPTYMAYMFRRVATEVAVALEHAYPREIDERMSAHLTAVRERAAIDQRRLDR
jgi:aminoglycoside 6-adenylyltransferase